MKNTHTHTVLSGFAAGSGQSCSQTKITLEDIILPRLCVISSHHDVDSAAETAGYKTESRRKLSVMGFCYPSVYVKVSHNQERGKKKKSPIRQVFVFFLPI